MTHRGPTLGFRIEDAGTTVCYLPDHEPALVGPIDTLEDSWLSGFALAHDADVLIHDAQYTDEEYPAHFGWGHSAVSHALDFASALRRQAHRPVPPRPVPHGRGPRRDPRGHAASAGPSAATTPTRSSSRARIRSSRSTPRAPPDCDTVDSVVLLSQYIRATAITGRSDTLNASWFAGRQGGRWAEQTVRGSHAAEGAHQAAPGTGAGGPRRDAAQARGAPLERGAHRRGAREHRARRAPERLERSGAPQGAARVNAPGC